MNLPVTELGPPVFAGGARWTDLAALVSHAGPLATVLTTFDAEAGTAWHTHRHEQVLVVTSGSGVLEFADRRRELRSGDVVVVPPGCPHRHVAARGSMTHVSLTVPGDLEVGDIEVGDIEVSV